MFFRNLRNVKICLNITHLPALINNSLNKIKKCTNVKITFLHAIYLNSDVFLYILIIFTELLNVNMPKGDVSVFSNSLKMIKIDGNMSEI